MVEFSRREFVARVSAAGAAAMVSRLWLPPGAGAACGFEPPGFPAGIPLRRTQYENWSTEIRVDALWTAVPRSAADVCVLADWARLQGWSLRPSGMRHNWSPLTVGLGASCSDRTMLVNTTTTLAGVEIVSTSPGEVRAGAGALLEDVVAEMQEAGLGFTAYPVVGAMTIGGVLAIDGHGAAIPALGEKRPRGAGYGSLSDLVLAVTAVVWSSRRGRHVLRTFDRSDPRCDALMVSLGQAFITEVRLRAIPNQRLRCVSRTDIPAAELFAAPGSRGTTFASLVDRTGRVEALWFPFTDAPWLKIWSVAPRKPASSRAVSGPYNYPFTDNFPDPVVELMNAVVTGNPEITPAFGKALGAAASAGLVATASTDLWGWSKDTLLYLKPTTTRVAHFGYTVLCSRADIQWVIHTFTHEYARRLADAAREGRYPINMPLELRVTGVDDGRAVGVDGARPPLLSAIAAVRRKRAWDCAVWLNLTDLTGTPGAPAFKAGLEAWVRSTFDGTRALARAEWSKGWGYDDSGSWRRDRLATVGAPYGYRRRIATRTFKRLDPHSVFRTQIVRGLLG